MFLNWYSILRSIKHNGEVTEKQKSTFLFRGFLQQQLLSSLLFHCIFWKWGGFTMFRITKIADFIQAMKELLTKKAHCSSWIQYYHWFEKKHHLGISIVCDHLSFYFKTETGFSRSKNSLRPVHFNALEVSINTSIYIIMQQNCS